MSKVLLLIKKYYDDAWMHVTTKGQVTIPRKIREKLGIKAGADVDFVENVPLILPETK